MELLVNPANYDNAIELIKLGVSQIYVGISHHSIHMNAILSLVELKTLLRYKQNTKILISINRFFFEPDLDPLQTLLTDLKALNIDGIIFSDFAVIQIAKEINLQTNFIYRPNTLVTNYGQFDFYLKNNIHSVVLANELNKKEVWDIAKNKNQMQIYMQISGHVLMMESRWHLISNFVKTQSTINLDLTNKKLFLKEPTRKVPTIIYEDAHGTYVFTNYDLCLIDAIDELQTNHVDVVIIDSFLHDDIWINQMTKLFMSKINHQIVNFDQQVLTNPISKGFYEGTKNNLVYLLTEGVYE